MISCKSFKRSVIVGLAAAACNVYHLSSVCAEEKIALSAKEFRSFPIRKITPLTPNTRSYVIELPTSDHLLGTSTASCLMVKGPIGEDGKPMIRPYTPTSTPNEKGTFELVVKSYPNGNVSKYFSTLKVGDNIEVKGPMIKFPYKPNMKKSISCLAGGSGVTPMIQVIKEVLNNPEDKTQIHLIFANNTEDDIILKSFFDDLAKKHSNFKVTFVVATPTQASYKGYTGFISKDILTKCIAHPSPDTLVLVCGPPPFMNSISGPKTPDYKQGTVDGILKELGYTEDQVFKF